MDAHEYSNRKLQLMPPHEWAQSRVKATLQSMQQHEWVHVLNAMKYSKLVQSYTQVQAHVGTLLQQKQSHG